MHKEAILTPLHLGKAVVPPNKGEAMHPRMTVPAWSIYNSLWLETVGIKLIPSHFL